MFRFAFFGFVATLVTGTASSLLLDSWQLQYQLKPDDTLAFSLQPSAFSWPLEVKNIKIQKNRNLGKNWDSAFESGWYSLDSYKQRQVTVTLPGGKVETFLSTLNPSSQFFYPIESTRMTFTNQPGTYGQLEIDGDNQAHLDGFMGFVNLINLEDFSIFDPTRFRYTSAEGERYLIDTQSGLEQRSDRNGNTLTITTNGITHSSGVSVTFRRDAQGRITNIVDTAGRVVAYGYDAQGDLTRFVDRENQTNRFEYTLAAHPHYLTGIYDARGVQAVRNLFDDSGRMVGQVDAAGYTNTFTHALSENREIVTDRLGNVTVHEYDGNGNILRTVDALGGETTYGYDALDNVLAKTNALGQVTTYTYDSRGNRVSETDPLGNTTRHTYGPYRELTSVTDPRGFVTTNRYDAQVNLTHTTDALGQTIQFTHDSQGNIRTITDPLGTVIEHNYDAFGHATNTVVRTEQGAVLKHTAAAYDANGNPTNRTYWRTSAQGLEALTTRSVYDQENRLVLTIHADGSSNATIYALGTKKPLIEIDPMGREVRYAYDAEGNLTNTVYPDLSSESITYDAANRKIGLTDRAGQTSCFTNDALGRLQAMRYADGTVSRATYDALGRAATVQDSRGNPTSYGYDVAGRRTAITNALGQVTWNYYDANGNLTNSVDALGRSTKLIYDALNRRVQTVFADGTTQTTWYDALGRRTHEQDQAGKVTAYGYDALGQLTAVTNALGYVTRYAYDELGQQISQTDANAHTTTFEYDSLGRRTKRTLPGNQFETYAYNLGGLLTNKTDFNGQATAYAYDPMNRLVGRLPSVGVPVAYAYNMLGLCTNMTDASGVTAYAYDNRNRLVQKTTAFAGTSSASPWTATLAYEYDANGNLTNLVSSDVNGTHVSYEYDPLNRLSAVNDAQVGRTPYNYDAVGNLQSFTYPNGINTFYEYDSLNRLTNLASSKVVTPMANYAYTVGAAGQRLTANEQLMGSTLNTHPTTINRVYEYDNVYGLMGEQITVGTNSPASLNYAYDPVGNRQSRSVANLPLLPQSFTFDANDRLATDTYDANGNTVVGRLPSVGVVSDQYDSENRLIHRNNPDGSTIDIAYDGDGNRVRKTVATATNTVTTFYVVDEINPTGYAQVIEELTSNSQLPTPAVTRVYTYGHALLSQDRATSSGWAVSYYGYDGHGSVRYLTDALGQVTDTYDYDAFGNLIAQHSSSQIPTSNFYLYSGEQYDPDLGLYYLRARYHNPDTGRFWTQDSFEGFSTDPSSLHKYTYCGNNPVNAWDPSGQLSLTEAQFTSVEIGCLAGIAVGGINKFLNAYQEGKRGWELAEETAYGALIGGVAGTGAGAVFAMTPAWLLAHGYTQVVVTGLLGGVALNESIFAAIEYEYGNYYSGSAHAFNAATSLTGLGLWRILAPKFVAVERVWSRAPQTLQDQMSLGAAKKGAGTKLYDNLGDPKFKGMEKWEYKVKSAEGRDSVIHYVRNPKTGELMDFKFKKHSNDVPTLWERTREPSVPSGNP